MVVAIWSSESYIECSTGCMPKCVLLIHIHYIVSLKAFRVNKDYS